MCPDSIKKATFGLEATNDYSESSLGGTMHETNKFGRINQHNASTIRMIGEMDVGRDLLARKRRRRRVSSIVFLLQQHIHHTTIISSFLGMFHQFSDKIQKCLLLVAIEDAPKTRKSNHEALELQRRCRGKKAEILKDLNLKKTKEGLIEATHYFSFRMFF